MFTEYLQKIPHMIEGYNIDLHLTNGDIINLNAKSICIIESKKKETKQNKKNTTRRVSKEVDFLRKERSSEEIDEDIDINKSILYVRDQVAYCIPLNAILYYIIQ